MTNAEAIDVIRDYLVNKVDNEPMQKACQLAIKALSAEPQIIACGEGELSTNLAEVGTDCIRRQAAIDALNEVTIVHSITDFDAISAILDLPSIQPKRGRWLYCEDTTADCVDGYRCDQCGLFVPWDYQRKSIDYIKDYNFCPNCGADMREVTE